MRKINRLLALLIGLTLILAACSQSDLATEAPGLTDEPGGIPTLSDLTPGAPLETPPVVPPDNATPPAETEPVETEAVATATVAATEPVSPTQPTTGGEVLPPTGMVDPGRVSNLLEFGVWNQQDEQIGEVEDLILDLEETQVGYVVVKAAESSELTAVPWEALTVVNARALSATSSQTTTVEGPQNDFVLKVDQNVYDGAPTIELETLPGIGEDAGDWDAEIARYWQDALGVMEATPSPTATIEINMLGTVRASELLDYSLEGGDGLVKASVNDILVDFESGEIKYLVVAFSFGAGSEKLVPIPLGIIQWDATNQMLTVTIDPQVVIAAPSFDASNFPETIVPDWDAQFRTYWESYFPVKP